MLTQKEELGSAAHQTEWIMMELRQKEEDKQEMRRRKCDATKPTNGSSCGLHYCDMSLHFVEVQVRLQRKLDADV